MIFRQKPGIIGWIILAMVIGCVFPKPEWENVESDHEPTLNVFGLISLDEETISFVDVHRTLTLDEQASSTWGIDFESEYIVKDASVKIFDGSKQFSFTFMPWEGEYEKNDRRSYQNRYYDTTGTFIPKPNMLYQLSVTTEKWGILTGEVVTPNIPTINEKAFPDTIRAKIPYTMKFDLGGEVYGKISTRVIDGYYCGIEFSRIVSPGTTEWTTPPNDCLESERWQGVLLEGDSLEIILRTMDDQYYEYIIKESAGGFVDFLTGSGGIARSIGVEGGYGVFGAIAADRIYRPLIP
ncbi:MAG: DUF4249 family protein [Candidatus Marinimicrobia bacterium]|nr:DUF4249 family protein [Candidatus Neomarinimicrobiota bacterium]MBL7009643.1 DUF4249 family protein [Candidatus Neomarinimicrobiota bacterium]MBL7029614.1 DUF4249 family protein [Candidatus Neomarinimicrobiota bacterium]